MRPMQLKLTLMPGLKLPRLEASKMLTNETSAHIVLPSQTLKRSTR
jgi:hypothetical protein